jgi:hypothetical protein
MTPERRSGADEGKKSGMSPTPFTMRALTTTGTTKTQESPVIPAKAGIQGVFSGAKRYAF